MAKTQITAPVVAYISRRFSGIRAGNNADSNIYVNDMAVALGLSVGQIQNVLRDIVAYPDHYAPKIGGKVEVVTRGQQWMLIPNLIEKPGVTHAVSPEEEVAENLKKVRSILKPEVSTDGTETFRLIHAQDPEHLVLEDESGLLWYAKLIK